MDNKIVKANLFVLLLVVVLALSIVPAMGAVVFVNPTSSSTISGTSKVLNVTGTALKNCTFYAKSASTANSTWSTLGTFKNFTGVDGSVNGTFNTNSLEDATNYYLNATCWNATSNLHDGTISSVLVDNKDPTAPTSPSPASGTRDTDGSVTFSATVTDRETTECTLYFTGTNPGDSSYSMTYSTTSCSKTITAMPEQSYDWYVQASDGTNTTNSATTTSIVDINTGGAKGGALWLLDQQEKSGEGQTLSLTGDGTSGQNNFAIVLVIIAVIIIVAIVIKRRN